MTKRMRELQAQIAELTKQASGYMAEGEGRDLNKAAETFDKIDELQREYDLEARKANLAKAAVPAEVAPKKADSTDAFLKAVRGQALTADEKAMLSGEGAQNGENLLIPEDIKVEINELRKTYVSARSIVTVETTDALAGSVNYEAGEPAGLVAFEDGAEISAADEPKFVRKQFTIGHYGKIIPVSRILLGAEKAGLVGYLNRWFVRGATITENGAIFGALKAGYNEGTPKAVEGWEALKKSINVDLDPAVKVTGHIVTNQSGFACLDEEVDGNGRPILQQNPANPTEKIFQGLRVVVFPDAQLPNHEDGTFPIFYGDTKAGATFVEHKALEFATSEHYGFSRNQNYIRVIEGFDVMSTDGTAYIYGAFSATV